MVDEFHNERVHPVLNVMTHEPQLNVLEVDMMRRTAKLGLPAQAYVLASRVLLGFEYVSILYGDRVGDIAVEALMERILHDKGALLHRRHEGILDGEVLAVDGGGDIAYAARAGVAHYDAHGQCGAAQKCEAGIADVVVEAVGEVLLVGHQHGTARFDVGQ